jgi:hypothetical protein
MIYVKAITLYDNNIKDFDIDYMRSVLSNFVLNLDAFYLHRNQISDVGVSYLLGGLINAPAYRNITNLSLSENYIIDKGVALLAGAISRGEMPATKVLNLADNNITDTGAAHLADSLKSKGNKLNVLHLEGNKFTTNGIGHFVKALESPKVIDVSIVFEIANKSKSVIDFIEKGLKYAIKQHAQSKWEVDKIRSNVEGEKWKDCKDMALNVGMGLMSDAKTCLGFKSKEAIFVCVTAEVGWELFRPETLGCLVDVKDYAVDTLGEFNDSDCCIF